MYKNNLNSNQIKTQLHVIQNYIHTYDLLTADNSHAMETKEKWCPLKEFFLKKKKRNIKDYGTIQVRNFFVWTLKERASNCIILYCHGPTVFLFEVDVLFNSFLAAFYMS